MAKITEQITPAQIRSLPKVELHRHLDCSMRWSTLVNTLGLDPKKNSEYLITDPMKNLKAVLKKFSNAQKALASYEILERLAYEACEDAFNEGVLILELRYAPTFIQQGHPDLTWEKIHEAIYNSIKKAESQWPMSVGLIAIIQRQLKLKDAQKLSDFIFSCGTSFVGIDLADDEKDFPFEDFAPIFQRARTNGLGVTIHSGEIPHPQAAQWVKKSVDILGAQRIGHGIQIINDKKIMEYLSKKKILLEVCPHSNWLTQAFSSFDKHPLRKLYDFGVQVCLNADDPGIFISSLIDDYILARDYHKFGWKEFNQCNKWAFQASFISKEKKEYHWKGNRSHGRK